MSEATNLLNPVTGRPFVWNEYYSFNDTILIFGLETSLSTQIYDIAAKLNIKVYECRSIEDLLAIPAFMAVVNPRKITRAEAVILTELWQECDTSEFKVIFVETPYSYWPLPLPSCVKVEPELFADQQKLRLNILKQKTSANRQDRLTRQYEERISRILMILKRLQKGPVKTRELAEEFKVSVRTVQRDIGILERIGEPIGYDEQEKAFFLLTREN
ncbi:MAG: HTH domain-containing protein [Desulfotomaculales bacterium]